VVHDDLATRGRNREGVTRRCLLGAVVSAGEGDARGNSDYACMRGWWQLGQEQPVMEKGRAVPAAVAGARAWEPAMAARSGARGRARERRWRATRVSKRQMGVRSGGDIGA
jgi:hypothetical protein